MRAWLTSPGVVKALALGGMGAAALDVALTFSFGALHADYSHVWHYISELGEAGRPYAGLVNAWFVLEGLLLAGLALALYAGLPPSRAVTLGASLYLLWAAAGAVTGVFPCDPGCAGRTWPAQVHLRAGQLSAVCILPVPALVWLGLRRHRRWAGYGWFTLAVQVAAAASFLLLAASYYGHPPAGHWLGAVGAFQRMNVWAFYLWTIGIGWQLARSLPEQAA